MKNDYVYILTSKRNGTLYIGVTNNLLRRNDEHQAKVVKGFTEKYNVGMLVYYEVTNSIDAAIAREKQLKQWHRQWKVNLIQSVNPDWNDLLNEVDPETSSG